MCWILGRQVLVRSVKQSVPQWERAGSAHSTLQLSTRYVADRSREKCATEAAQTPGSSTATSISAATMPASSAPAYSTPQPCTRPGTNTMEKGIRPWAASERNRRDLHRQCIGLLWPQEPHFLQQSPPLGKGTHSRAMEPYWTQPSELLLQNQGADPESNEAMTTTEKEETPPHIKHRLQTLQNKSHPLSRG